MKILFKIILILYFISSFYSLSVASPIGESVEKDTLDTEKFNIYPNPAKDYVYLDLQDACTCDLSVKIIAENGDEIYKNENFGDVKLAYINLKKFSNGVYFVNIFDGTNIYTKKLIISR